MSSFTKSMIYSGFVLVAGLVAIIAIQNNMGYQTGATMSMKPIIPQIQAAAPAQYDNNSPATAGEGDAVAAASRAADEAVQTMAMQLKNAIENSKNGNFADDLSQIEPAAGGSETANSEPRTQEDLQDSIQNTIDKLENSQGAE